MMVRTVFEDEGVGPIRVDVQELLERVLPVEDLHRGVVYHAEHVLD